MDAKALYAMNSMVDYEAEEQVIGYILGNLTEAPRLMDSVDKSCFLGDKFAWLHEAIGRLPCGSGDIDLRTVMGEVRSLQNSYKAQGKTPPDSLMEIRLDWMKDLRPASNIERAVEQVVKMAQARHIFSSAMRMIDSLQTNAKPAQVVDEFVASVGKIQRTKSDNVLPGHDLIDQLDRLQLKMIDDFENNRITPNLYPWDSWNKKLDPLVAGKPFIIYAPPGGGKTTYLLQNAKFSAANGKKVVFVHTEDQAIKLYRMLICSQTDIRSRSLKTGDMNATEKAKYEQAKKEIGYLLKSNLTLVNGIGRTMPEILSEIRQLVADGCCDVLCFDYLAATNAISPGDNETMNEKKNIISLMTVASKVKHPDGREGLPTMVGNQLNKKGEAYGTTANQWFAGTIIHINTTVLEQEVTLPNGLVLEAGESHPDREVKITKQNDGGGGILKQCLDGPRSTISDGSIFAKFRLTVDNQRASA